MFIYDIIECMKTIEEPISPEKSNEKEVVEKHYHFEEMAEIEPAAIELVKKLKESIEEGKYDALISDDAGGRIPTLLLRKIMRKIRPDKEVPTLFVKGGFSTPGRSRHRGNWDMGEEMRQFDESNITDEEAAKAEESKREMEKESNKDQEKLLDYLKNFKDRFHPKNPLLVTQFIRTGASVGALSEALREAGLVENVSIVTLEKEGKTSTHHKISEEHEKLSGVEKANGRYSPIPSATRKREHPLLPYSEWKILKQELDKEYYGDKYNDYYKDVFPRYEEVEKMIREDMDIMSDRPISKEEIQKIQNDINLAREDIDLMSERIIKEVWD
jgi:hypothetical protein